MKEHPLSAGQPVPPAVYTREYYLTDNSGFALWRETGGSELEPRHEYAFAQAKVTSKDVVLDYGCGRGEIVLHSALRGARVIGVDYSQAAIELSRETIGHAGLCENDGLQIFLLDGKQLPFPDETFTRIFFLDVIEHLTPVEVSTILREFERVLRPQGRLILHTAPNRTYYDYAYPRFTYPFSKLLDSIFEKARGRSFYNLPIDPRTPSEKVVHINEQSLGSIRKSLEGAGFECRAWVSDRLLNGVARNPRYVVSRMLIKPSFWPLNSLFATDLWAVARKEEGETLLGCLPRIVHALLGARE